MLATDPLSLLFLGCALFSGLFLVATVMLGTGHTHLGHVGHVGHLGHVGHAGVGHSAAPAHSVAQPQASHTAPNARGAAQSTSSSGQNLWSAAQSALLGSLNLNSALIFLLMFGLAGYLLHNGQGLSLLGAVALAALVGAVTAIGVNAALTRIFITSQAGELSAASSQLDGRLATVSISIRAEGLGEVVYNGEAGARQSIGARSSDGSAISAGAQVVIVAAEGGMAIVQPWDSFIADTRQRLSAAPAAEGASGLAPTAPPGVPSASEPRAE